MNRAILQNPTEPFEMLCFFVGHESRRMHASENPVLEFMLCKFETYAPPSALQASAAVTTLNRRLYLLLRDAIFNGQIAAGAKLPSSRSVANALKIARNTVVYAYDQLAAEGYVSGNAGSGTFVNDTLADTNPAPADMSEVIRQASSLRPLLSRRGGELIADARALATQSGAFVPGVPDVSQFPHAIWRRLQLGYWRRPNSSLMAYASDGGHLPLRKALCDYLSVARSVRCTPEQILITSGTHQSIDLCGRLLGDVGEHAWIEDPCYWGARNVLQMAGLELHPVPVDEEGLNPQSQHLQHPPRLIYVTPSHQYPLGSIMSLSRRRLLLEYARHHQCWILEDDYDSEFRYNARPLASLQGLDDHDRVIYMGTFSKAMYPVFRMGYMVLPLCLARTFATAHTELYRDGQLVLQAALGDFIAQGYFSSHVRRTRLLYGERQRLLQQAIDISFPPAEAERLGIFVRGGDAGMHLVLELPAHCDDVAISKEAARYGVTARALSTYYADPETAFTGLVLGYASVPEETIPKAFSLLASIIKAHQAIGPHRDSTASASARRRSAALNALAWSGA